jgi:hypothetical protein
MGQTTRKAALAKGPRIEHVISIGDNDCGVCAAAMLTGFTYTDAWLAANGVSPSWERRGLSCKAIVEVLTELMGDDIFWEIRRMPYPRKLVHEFQDWPAQPVIAVLRRDSEASGHVVVHANGYIHDSWDHKGYRVSTYAKKLFSGVRVVAMIQQIIPDDAA